MKFDKRILASMLMIALLSVSVGAYTMAYFSDTEEVPDASMLSIGKLDITVGTATKIKVENLIPCETATVSYDVESSISTMDVDVFARVTNVLCDGGELTDPEAIEEDGNPIDYIAGYVIYDLSSQSLGPIIPEEQELRVDNIQNLWVYVGSISVGETRKVTHSFHLSSWKDSPREITNWAQGDTMSFNIEVYATQVGAPAPKINELKLVEKDSYWEPVDAGKFGILNFATNKFTSDSFDEGEEYTLIYYKDYWPGTGSRDLGSGTVDGANHLEITVTLGTIPEGDDNNFDIGGKVWLVLSSDFDGDEMTGWHPGSYLFEEHLIKVP